MSDIILVKEYVTIENSEVKYSNKVLTSEDISDIIEDNIDTNKPVHIVKSPYGPNWDYISLYDLALTNGNVTVVWIPQFISLSGSTVYGKKNPRDTDIIIRMEDEIRPDSSLNTKLTRLAFGLPDNTVLDLVLVENKSEVIPVKDSVEVKELITKVFRTGNKKLEKEALESKRKDEVIPSRMIMPGKPELNTVNAYRSGEVFKYDDLVDYIKQYSSRFNTDFIECILQLKVDGARHLIFKDKDKIKIISEDGTDNTKKFSNIIDKLSKTDKSFVLDSEIELFEKDIHQPREVMSGVLHSNEMPENYHFVINIFDCLYLDKDLHKEPYKTRLEALDSLDIFSGNEDKERYKYELNKLKSYYVSNENELKKTIDKLLKIEDGEGVMVKPANSIYPLNGNVPWWKLKKFAEVHAIVYDKTETKDKKAFNYDIALRYDGNIPVDENTLIKYEDTFYVPVGRTYNTAVDVPKWGIITVSFHNLNVYESNGNYSINLYEPKFIEYNEDITEADSVSTALNSARKAGILNTKKEIRKISFLPIWLNEDKEYEYMIHRHCIGKSVADKTPVYIKYDDTFDIVPIYTLIPAKIKQNEYIPENIYVWTSNGWSKILRVFRHPIQESQMYQVITDKNIAEVTGSHSLYSEGKEITVNDIKEGTVLDTVNPPPLEGNDIDVDLDTILLVTNTLKYGEKVNNYITYPLKLDELLIKFKKKFGCFYIKNDMVLLGGFPILYQCFAGKTVVFKRIPKAVFYWKLEHIKTLLENLMLKNKSIKADSMQLAEQIIYLGSLVYNSYKLTVDKNCYYISFNKNADNKVYQKIESKEINQKEKKFYYPVSKFVYDIETENHDFVGGLGFIRYHNSTHLDWRAKTG